MKTLTNNKIDQQIKFTQLVLMDYEGRIIESCDTIFSTQELKLTPLTESVVLIESIFDILIKLQPNDPEIRISKVEIPANFLPGYYDFTFSSVLLDNKKYILWSIFDFTELYLDLMKYQQSKNELEIRRQAFELRNRNITSVKDILNKDNFFVDFFNQKQEKHFSAQLHELLLSHENALDTFSIINLANHTDENVFQGLKGVFVEVNNIKNELDLFGHNIDGTDDIFNEAFSVNNLLEEVIALVKKEKPKATNISYSVQKDIQQQLIGYKQLIKQILFSLMINFYEQDPQTVIELFVSSVITYKDKSVLNIIIKDTSVNEKNTPINKPTGLVLRTSLIKKLAEMCKGQIVPLYDLTSPNIRVNLQIPVKIN